MRERAYNQPISEKAVIYMPVKVGLQYIDIWQESMEEQIAAYEQEPVIEGQIVFYGPSHYTRWSERFGMIPLQEALRGQSGAPCAVNRGFGSSCAEHQLYYYPRAVRPLKPKVLVYTFLANGPSFGYSPEESWELAQRVIAYAQMDFPGIHIYLVGAHPSRDITPEKVREHQEFAKRIEEFAENTANCSFINIMDYEQFFRKDIFVEDGIHYNQTGYDLYKDFYTEVLKDELKNY